MTCDGWTVVIIVEEAELAAAAAATPGELVIPAVVAATFNHSSLLRGEWNS